MSAERAFLAIVILAAGLGITPSFAGLDIMSPGDQIEAFNVPNVYPCPDGSTCHGLWFTIRLQQPTCIRYEDIWAKRPDGSPLTVGRDESGEPGRPGYELNLYVDDSGPMILHIKNVKSCGEV